MKKLISLITLVVTCISISAFNTNAQVTSSVFTKDSKRVFVAIGLPDTSLGSIGISAYGAYEKGIYVAGPIVVCAGADVEIGSEDSLFGYSIGGYIKSRYSFTEKLDAALFSGMGYGAYGHIYGLTRVVGLEASMAINPNMRGFVSVCANSFPGKGNLKVGITISL